MAKLTFPKIGRMLVLLTASVASMLPIYWTLVNSFRSNTQIMNSFRLFPENLDFKNYASIFAVSSLPTYFLNSCITTGSAMILVGALALTCSFALSTYKFKFAKLIHLIIVAGIFIPSTTTMGMTYKLLQTLNLLGSRPGIILLYTSGRMALSIFLLTAYMKSIPDAIKEAALMDGCGPWRMLVSIVAPLSRNGLLVVMILTFIGVWNDYIWSMILLPSSSKRTLTVGLAFFRGEFFTDNGQLSACVIVGLVPILIGYLFLQDKIINGIASSAVKG
ncbi:MAG: carbohydrate ABC transporter permease [Clostridiales bacterium]|nr:carbohydrate ABC transporter permease [Clostridiales bacterium]